MADPTPEEVYAALAVLAAAEVARESHVGSTPAAPEPAPPVSAVVSSESTAEPIVAALPISIDPYLARSVKSSPNGF